MTGQFLLFLIACIVAIFLLSDSCKAQYLGANMVNFETYTDDVSNEWFLDCYQPGDTMSFRLRMEADKGFVSTAKYISFNNQAVARNITVKFMVLIDFDATPQTNLNNITALVNAGCYIPDIELGNEYYAKDPDGLKHTCSFNFDCYKLKFESQVNTIKAVYPNMRFFFSLAPNSGRTENTNWNNSIKNYISLNPNYHVAYHLYFNDQVAPSLGDSLISQTTTSSYNSYLDNYFSSIRTDLFQTTLIQDTENYLSLNFPGKDVAYTEIGILGGDDGKDASTSLIRNTFTYAERLYIILNELDGYEIDIHSGIALTGIIQPLGKNDLISVYKNKKTFEYYSLFLHRELGAKTGLSYLGLNDTCYLFGHFATNISLHYASAPYTYTSCGDASYKKKGSLKESYDPLNGTGDYKFGYKEVMFVEIVEGCTDPLALNYNSEANADDLSCYYEFDCKCKDPEANNYDLSAPCENNSLCTYTPRVCYKQRIIFKFLGCKEDKDCKFNNCGLVSE